MPEDNLDVSGGEEKPVTVEISQEELDKLNKIKDNYSGMQSQRDTSEAINHKVNKVLQDKNIGSLEIDGSSVVLNMNTPQATQTPNVEETFEQKKAALDKLYDDDEIDDKEWNKKSMALQREDFQNTLKSSLDKRDSTNSEKDKQNQYIADFTKSIDSEFQGHNDPESPFFKQMQKEIQSDPSLKAIVNQTLENGEVNPNFNASARRLLMDKAATKLESNGEWKRNMQDNINRSMNTGGQSTYVENDMSTQAGLDRAKILISKTMGAGSAERLSKGGMDTIIKQIHSKELYNDEGKIEVKF